MNRSVKQTLARLAAAEQGSIYSLRDPSIVPTFPCWFWAVSHCLWYRIRLSDLTSGPEGPWKPRFDANGVYQWSGWSHWSASKERPAISPEP